MLKGALMGLIRQAGMIVLLLTAPAHAQAGSDISEQEAYEIGVEAYQYLYPLVMMDVTRRVTTNAPPGVRSGLGPANAFHHVRTYPSAEAREVVRPNFDTLYSIAWLDLTKEPMIVSAPDAAGRFYLLPMMDMWTDVFAAPGARTSGTTAANFAVARPDWRGALPQNAQRIDAPTPYVWIIGRTQTNGAKDYDAVHKVQDGYVITPLSQWGREPPPPVQFNFDPAIDMRTKPLDQVNQMPAGKYFAYAAELMQIHPPHVTDWSEIARLKRIGLEPGKKFDLEAAPPTIKSALERAAAEGLKSMKAKAPTLARIVNGWQMNTDTMGVYGNHYLKRAIIAMGGLGANQPEDAIYPVALNDSDGRPLTGGGKYLLHFDKSELPPASAFWSVTMYDAQGYQTANAINRFAIGDRDNLRFNPDGSLDIFIQGQSPGAEKESNWLPSPASGVLGVTMRLYSPRAPALDGGWAPPAIRRVDD